MSINTTAIAFGLLVLLSGCKQSTSMQEQKEVKQQVEPVERIEGLNEDSIKIVQHKNVEAQGDYSAYERTVFLDYKKHSKYKRDYYRSDSLYSDSTWFSYRFFHKYPTKENLVINSCNSILKTYVTITKLNGSYILFSNEIEAPILTMVYVKDSVLRKLNLMGWEVFYYKKLECKKDRYRIELFGAEYETIEIKVIDSENDIQVWKTGVGSHIRYDLKAPLNYALNLPILIIQNTLGLDAYYEGLDEPDLEKLFNEQTDLKPNKNK